MPQYLLDQRLERLSLPLADTGGSFRLKLKVFQETSARFLWASILSIKH
jgi:hypothetical protein